jgi:hypothetical protein
MGGMGGGMGMGMMNIAPEKVAQFRVATVCLEHGKREPRSAMPYEIKPIEVASSKPEVKELLTTFGKRQLNQRATQAAAWHLASGLSWEQLATKQAEQLGGFSEPYFHPAELQAAMQIATVVTAQVEERSKSSTSQSASLAAPATKSE